MESATPKGRRRHSWSGPWIIGRSSLSSTRAMESFRSVNPKDTGIIRAHHTAFTCWIILGVSVAMLSTVSLGHSEGRIWLITEPTPGMPRCDEFYDKWEVLGAPAGIMAMAGYAREVFAAKDCIDKNNVPMACKHWQGLLSVIDRKGPPLDERRGDIEKLMREHNCEAAHASDSKPAPAPKITPNSEKAPAKAAPNGD